MHTARVIAAMIAGGYASILAAHLLAQMITVGSPVSPGAFGVALGPLTVGMIASLLTTLLPGKTPR